MIIAFILVFVVSACVVLNLTQKENFSYLNWKFILPMLVLILDIPFIINELYILNTGYSTLWEAKDVLAFYGAFLAFLGTATLGFISLEQNKKLHKENLRIQKEKELLEHRPIIQIHTIDFDVKACTIDFNENIQDAFSLSLYPKSDDSVIQRLKITTLLSVVTDELIEIKFSSASFSHLSDPRKGKIELHSPSADTQTVVGNTSQTFVIKFATTNFLSEYLDGTLQDNYRLDVNLEVKNRFGHKYNLHLFVPVVKLCNGEYNIHVLSSPLQYMDNKTM